MSINNIIKVVTLSALFASASCTSLPSNRETKLTLSQVDKVNLAEVTNSNAEQKFGKPTLKDYLDKDHLEEGWLYVDGNPATTRLSLIFSASTGKLISAHWFINEMDPEANFDAVRKRYPHVSFDLKNPSKKEGLYGPTLFFNSQNSPMKVAIDEKSNLVNSLSWRLAPSLIPDKRKPTSH